MLLAVALARGGAGGDRLSDAPEVVFGELQARGLRVLLQALAALGAGYWDDVLALGEEPGEGELARRAGAAGKDLSATTPGGAPRTPVT